ncbi:hypothetical protein [Mesorhizobium sp. A556]
MDPIEKAIRNAFEKGNADDRAFREKVYRSAFAALDRALQANPGTTVEIAIKRRKSMQAKIAEIESEYLPAVAVVAPEITVGRQASAVEAPSVSVGPEPTVDKPVSDRDPALEADRTASLDIPATGSLPVPDIALEPILAGSTASEAGGNGGVEVMPDRDERRAARRRLPSFGLLFGLALLAILGAGLWWALQSGALKMPVQPGSSPSAAEGEQPAAPGVPLKPGQADEAREWITVFSPSDPTLVSAPADAGAEVMKDDTGSFLRIRSGASGSAISFDVGQGILESLAGKHAVFDILARAEEGKETQMSVDCNFGDMGDCGRKRYVVGNERNEYLFDVQFPDKHPGAAGTIAVNSDFGGGGKSVDIYQIRVSIAE